MASFVTCLNPRKKAQVICRMKRSACGIYMQSARVPSGEQLRSVCSFHPSRSLGPTSHRQAEIVCSVQNVGDDAVSSKGPPSNISDGDRFKVLKSGLNLISRSSI